MKNIFEWDSGLHALTLPTEPQWDTRCYTATQWQTMEAAFNIICQKQHFPAIVTLIVQMNAFTV